MQRASHTFCCPAAASLVVFREKYVVCLQRPSVHVDARPPLHFGLMITLTLTLTQTPQKIAGNDVTDGTQTPTPTTGDPEETSAAPAPPPRPSIPKNGLGVGGGGVGVGVGVGRHASEGNLAGTMGRPVSVFVFTSLVCGVRKGAFLEVTVDRRVSCSSVDIGITWYQPEITHYRFVLLGSGKSDQNAIKNDQRCGLINRPALVRSGRNDHYTYHAAPPVSCRSTDALLLCRQD